MTLSKGFRPAIDLPLLSYFHVMIRGVTWDRLGLDSGTFHMPSKNVTTGPHWPDLIILVRKYSLTYIIWPSLICTSWIICTVIIWTIVCFPIHSIDFDVWIIQTFSLICTKFGAFVQIIPTLLLITQGRILFSTIWRRAIRGRNFHHYFTGEMDDVLDCIRLLHVYRNIRWYICSLVS